MSKSKDVAVTEAAEAPTTSLVPQVASNLPASAMKDDAYEKLATASAFLGRLQLYDKNKEVSKGLINPGEWGIPGGGDKITNLGKEIDMLILARRPKALDLSDTSDIITSYDPNSETFKDIERRSGGKDSGCMFGTSFLVFERNSKRFIEYFAGTKTTREASGDLYPFLPEKQPEGTTVLPAVTATSEVIEKGPYTWRGPIFRKCSTPVQMPPAAALEEELTKFLNPEVQEEATEEEVAATTGRRR